MRKLSFALLIIAAGAAFTWRTREGRHAVAETAEPVKHLTRVTEGPKEGTPEPPAQPPAVVTQRVEQSPPGPSIPAIEARPPIPTSPPSPPPANSKQAHLKFFAAAADQLDAHLVAESVDPAWARGAQAEAERAFGRILSRSSILRSVECRTGLCRLEAELPSYTDYREFANHALERETRPWNGAITVGPVEEKSDGRLIAHLYIAREGVSLAEPGPVGP